MNKKKPSDRIASLKTFIAKQENRVANLKAVQTIRAKIELAKKEAETLEATEAKRIKEEELTAIKLAADQLRKDDNHAKILWGAGLQLLDPDDAARTRAKILEVLNNRDREWMEDYAAKHKIPLSAQKPAESEMPRLEPMPSRLSEPVDPAAMVLLRTLKQFDSRTISHIEAEFLGGSDGADRRVMEVLFAALGERHSV